MTITYTPKGYTDKESVENYGLVTIDVSFDDQVNNFIAIAESIIDSETGRTFEKAGAAADMKYDGDGTDTLLTDYFQDLVSIKLSPDGDALDSDDFYLYPANDTVKNKIVLTGALFPTGKQNIVVNAVWGEDVPADIHWCATVLVLGLINNAWQSDSEVQSITMGRYTVTYKDKEQLDDFAKVKEILASRRKYIF